MTLVDAVARWLALNPAWLGRHPAARPPTGLADAAPIWIGPPLTLSNQPPPQELEQMLHIARKFDVAARDERNRALGHAGEERVLAHERAALKSAGRDDLARKVRCSPLGARPSPRSPPARASVSAPRPSRRAPGRC